ncbi:MAG TPA: LppX_LprAFG lipoprotein [Gaiellaceae bacterium]|jgi:hypothetical protein|nr:LppX_LprAFG lipoprotein [Gaiellaceae bacterium]
MRRAALLLLVPLGLVAAACGGSGGSKAAGSSGSASVVQSGPSDTTYVNQAIAKGAKKPVHAVVSGLVDAAGQQVHMSGIADVDPKAQTGTIHVSVQLAGQQVPLDEVLDGKTVYISSSFFSSFLPSGKKWLKLNVASVSKTFGIAAFALTSQPGAVPPLKDVHKAGTATIDGVQTTEYGAQVDRAKMSPAAKAALGGASVHFGAIDVWVGSDGYVHRARIRTSAKSGGQKANVTVTSTMSNYGETVHVTVPPASQTVDAGKVGIPGFSS